MTPSASTPRGLGCLRRLRSSGVPEKKQEEIRARNAVTPAKALAEVNAAEQAARTQPPGRLWQVARVFRLGVDQALARLTD